MSPGVKRKLLDDISEGTTVNVRHFCAASLFFFVIFSALWNVDSEAWGQSDSIHRSSDKDKTGVDISEFTNVDAMGFFTPDRVRPWGRILSDETERIFLSQGDTVYLSFEKGHDVKPGDLFTVYKSSDSVEHPGTGRSAGFVVSFLGKIVLKSKVKSGVYKGEIVESYRHIEVGFPILPSKPLSPCVIPTDPDWQKIESIERGQMVLVASKDLAQYLGQYSVVYLSHGVNSGIQRGNLFEILALPEAEEAPDYVLGYLLVLEARPETATGIVISSKREFLKGTLVRPVNLEDALRKIAVYYGENDEQTKRGNIVVALQMLKKRIGSDLDLPPALLVISRLPTCFFK